ncbi:protein translocase subunit SecF [Candidatus Aerophobetes bacterium]|uniref:Protein-export membrane protein SecF n=1 Tax=Aerophobetes bacterium TaxID=2030807 RepID=A0A662D3X7_UNCAE|nr:MAG: protein translocase subunit SecF [Candidatus Aerophobetes bacterium]
MQLFKETHIDFIGLRKIAFIVSGIAIAAGLASLIFKGGPKLGLDFTGGVEIHLKFDQSPSIARIRSALREIDLEGAVIQQYGAKKENLILIRCGVERASQKELIGKIDKVLKEEFDEENAFVLQSIDMIGPKVSGELRRKAILAIALSLLGMLIYITWRFELRFAVGAVAALAHDIFVTTGALSLGNFEFTLPVIAALLTIIGYSLNDTIVIYDRLRENLKTYRKRKTSLKHVLNLGINQSLSRTVITSLTTFFVVIMLFLKGGAVLHGFAFALLIGIIVGTYSSSFIATPIVYSWGKGGMREK